ncbi:hypothetical protein L1987_32539 [Smallanthus sonchifolius]|uniref:Uncharacterized protein n=1 Tax=Smallanthus sonchifolius TaxID=185202 RepID=A0ACB9HPQ1_9ASTR|nr:hypothetical protein L1987_32539 [Smallanthus sonchifolius]
MFNTTAGGHIMERLELDECKEMFESFAQAKQQHPHSVRNSIPTTREPASSPRGVHQVTPETSVAVALDSMANEIKELKLSAQRCQVCRGGHDTRDCPVNNEEHVNYAGNQYQNRGYNNNNTYGSGWKSGNNPPRFNGRQQQYGGGEVGASSGSSVNTRKIEEMLENQTQLLTHLVQQDKDKRQRMDSHDTLLKNQQSAFEDLQRTVGYIAQSLKGRQGGQSSGSNASVMTVSVWSVEKKEVVEDDSHSIEGARVSTRSHREKKKETPPVVEEEEPVDEEIVEEKPAERAVEKKKKGEEMKSPEIDLSRVPYPPLLLPYRNAREYGAFLDMYKQLKVNLPFIEVLQHMPKFGKFLKDLLSNKKKLGGISEVSLSEQCSVMVQNKLPEKLGDSGRFTIPCMFGGLPLHYALADLGASINLIPYSIYKRLDLGKLQPTRMSISLADCSVKYPRGIGENPLVKVGKFVLLVDFVILDMEVDDRVPLILGRPFLRTAKAMIDVFGGKLTLRVGDEFITFDATNSVEDVGVHSHSVCMLDASMDDHRDSNPLKDDLDKEMLEEPPDWFKCWWKDLSAINDTHLRFGRSFCLLGLWRTGRPRRMKAVPVRIKEKPPDRLEFTLDLAWEIIGNEFPGFIIPPILNIHLGVIDYLLYPVVKATRQLMCNRDRNAIRCTRRRTKLDFIQDHIMTS